MKDGVLSFLGAIGCTILAVVIIIGAVAGGWAIKYYTADVRGRISANERIKSGSNRIAQYEFFFNKCAAVQGTEAQIDALMDQVKNSTDPKTIDRLNTNITGNMAQRQRSIFEYNAASNKSYTSAQFRDVDLPFELDSSVYTGENKTLCLD